MLHFLVFSWFYYTFYLYYIYAVHVSTLWFVKMWQLTFDYCVKSRLIFTALTAYSVLITVTSCTQHRFHLYEVLLCTKLVLFTLSGLLQCSCLAFFTLAGDSWWVICFFITCVRNFVCNFVSKIIGEEVLVRNLMTMRVVWVGYSLEWYTLGVYHERLQYNVLISWPSC